MADFDPAQSFFPSDSLPESDDEPFPVPSAPTEELPPVVREGLPPDYQMRHDIHYVEQLGSKAAGAPVRSFLPIKDIDRPQPLDVRDLGPLITSILELGMIQPVLVRRTQTGGQLFAQRPAGLHEGAVRTDRRREAHSGRACRGVDRGSVLPVHRAEDARCTISGRG